MKTKTKVKFDAFGVVKEILSKTEEEQTRRLIAYAKEEIQRIGDDISVFPRANSLDRTGNLLDSLCWGVFYKGSLKGFGYYREEQADEDSFLHEYSRPKGMSVNGHFMASQFIANYEPDIIRGWEVFFAVVAPYWGYWEEGFTHPISNDFFQWQVMTNHYDVVKKDLAPSKVEFNTYIPD